MVGALLVLLFRWQARDRATARPREQLLREGSLWGGAIAVTLILGLAGNICISAWLRYGVPLSMCPDGRVLQRVSVSASDLRRGLPGQVDVTTTALYTTDAADAHLEETVKGAHPRIFLVDGKGGEKALLPLAGRWEESDGGHFTAGITLPKTLPDGDYILRAKVDTRIGASSIDAPLALYAPARIHILTDRPLYEPGNNVQFRAVVLRATDYLPLDGRPGTWQVEDPSGELMLEEKAPAGPFGVVAGSFPLDPGADSGTWKVRWVSGADADTVTFRVEPFTLPRFRVEATAARPFYGVGDKPVLRGKVVYSSGAPVAAADLQITWAVQSEPVPGGDAWPAPPEWEAGDLPTTAKSSTAGTFEVALPAVPADLRGRVNLRARVSATDAAGDRVAADATVVLSQDTIVVTTLTELDGGLMQGFNNRLYLRVLGAGGDVLAGASVLVKQAWNPNDQGVTATTDADGVAALQMDPGPAINVVIPPMPFRRPLQSAAGATVERTGLRELVTGATPSLRDLRAMDGWNRVLLPCARFVSDEGANATVAARVSGAGGVTATAAAGDPLSRCVSAALAGQRLPGGDERLYEISFSLHSDLPRLLLGIEASPGAPSGLESALEAALADARTCVTRRTAGTSLPRVLLWSAKPARKTLSLSFVRDAAGAEDPIAAPVAACIERKVMAVKWADVSLAAGGDEEATPGLDALGVARISLGSSGAGDEEEIPQATTRLGYELSVLASAGDRPIGTTRIILDPGKVPSVRLRATPVLAKPGEQVVVNLLRGPDYAGALPDKLVMSHRNGTLEAKLDPDELTAKFKLPADAKGWFEVRHDSGRALVYVRPLVELAVTVKAGAERYAPGETAELQVSTKAGQRGIAAAVGLFGVDASLAQLAPLPGPDDLSRLRPMPTMRAPAFGLLDAKALEMGLIRGSNAAAATVSQVADLPAPAQVDALARASAATTFEPLVALTDNFYRVLGELRDRVRAWESTAPKSEKMRPATMAKLWGLALAECEKRKEAVDDAFGRKLRLGRLPGDLLALVDPRQLVIDGKRLPEDVENWGAWVAKEQP